MSRRKLESYRLAPLSDLNGRPGSACSASGIADFSDMSDPTPFRFKRFSSGLAFWELWLFDERVGDARGAARKNRRTGWGWMLESRDYSAGGRAYADLPHGGQNHFHIF